MPEPLSDLFKESSLGGATASPCCVCAHLAERRHETTCPGESEEWSVGVMQRCRRSLGRCWSPLRERGIRMLVKPARLRKRLAR